MRKYVFIFLTFILIMSAVNLSFGKTNNDNKTVVYHIVEVKKGDTLWEIAFEYKNDNISTKEYVLEIKDFNNLKTDVIKVGQTIIVPVES